MGQSTLQKARIDPAIPPQALTGTVAVNSGWYPMSGFAAAAVILVINGLSAVGATITLLVREATSAAGAGAQTLITKVIDGGVVAGKLRIALNPVRRATVTLDTVIATDIVKVGDTTKTFVAASIHTATLLNAIATDAITVAGVTKTFVANGATGDQVNIGVSDALSATAMAAAIDSIEGVTATATDAVITIKGTSTAVTPTTTDTTITIAAVALGANEVRIGATDAACATNMAAAIDALDGVTASATGDVITVLGSALDVTTTDSTVTIVTSAAANGDTVEINGETLTFKTTGTGEAGAAAAGEVLLGASNAALAVNLLAAINALDGVSAAAVAQSDPPAIDITAGEIGGVTAEATGATLVIGTLVEHALVDFAAEDLSINTGYSHIGLRVTSSASGVTAGAVLLREGARYPVRQDL